MEVRLPFWLSIFGASPFIFLSVSIAFGWHENQETALEHLLIYAAVIFSFLGGIHWGIAVVRANENPRAAAIMILESTFAPIFAWLIMFIGDANMKLLCFSFLYALIWGIDSLLYNNKIIPLWFFNLRGTVTPLVVVSMYVAYFSVG